LLTLAGALVPATEAGVDEVYPIDVAVVRDVRFEIKVLEWVLVEFK
jgi:hypothetical protein